MAAGLEARVSKHDREIAAIRKLIMTGMKLLVQSEKNLVRLEGMQEEMRKDMRDLTASQRETDRMLKTYLRGVQNGRGGNGRTKS